MKWKLSNSWKWPWPVTYWFLTESIQWVVLAHTRERWGQTSQFTVVTKEGNLNLMRTKIGARKGQDQSDALTTVEQWIRQTKGSPPQPERWGNICPDPMTEEGQPQFACYPAQSHSAPPAPPHIKTVSKYCHVSSGITGSIGVGHRVQQCQSNKFTFHSWHLLDGWSNLGAEYEPFSECFIHRKLLHVQFKLQ
jgi:hypothetical protein